MDSFCRGQENNIFLHFMKWRNTPFHCPVFLDSKLLLKSFPTIQKKYLTRICGFSIRNQDSVYKDFFFNVDTCQHRNAVGEQPLHTNNPTSSCTCSHLPSFPSVVTSPPLEPASAVPARVPGSSSTPHSPL